MSFIVSFKGQFRPYELPDLRHYDRVHHLYKLSPNKKLQDHEDDDFEGELGAALAKSKKFKNKQAITTYEKIDKYHQQHKIPYLARDLMSRPVECLLDTDSLELVIQKMQKLNFRHFPIIDKENHLMGIVSDRDILRVIHLDHSMPISQFMTTEVLTALDATRIQDIAKIMLHEKINSLPIINEKRELVGIITQSNILDYVIRSYPLETNR